MKKTTLKQIKQGEMFTLKPLEYPKETQVYTKGEYDRTEKKFACEKWWNISECRWLKSSTVVYIDFIF